MNKSLGLKKHDVPSEFNPVEPMGMDCWDVSWSSGRVNLYLFVKKLSAEMVLYCKLKANKPKRIQKTSRTIGFRLRLCDGNFLKWCHSKTSQTMLLLEHQIGRGLTPSLAVCPNLEFQRTCHGSCHIWFSGPSCKFPGGVCLAHQPEEWS